MAHETKNEPAKTSREGSLSVLEGDGGAPPTPWTQEQFNAEVSREQRVHLGGELRRAALYRQERKTSLLSALEASPSGITWGSNMLGSVFTGKLTEARAYEALCDTLGTTLDRALDEAEETRKEYGDHFRRLQDPFGEDAIQTELATRLDQRRRELGITNKELVYRVGSLIAESTLSRTLNFTNTLPPQTFIMLAEGPDLDPRQTLADVRTVLATLHAPSEHTPTGAEHATSRHSILTLGNDLLLTWDERGRAHALLLRSRDEGWRRWSQGLDLPEGLTGTGPMRCAMSSHEVGGERRHDVFIWIGTTALTATLDARGNLVRHLHQDHTFDLP